MQILESSVCGNICTGFWQHLQQPALLGRALSPLLPLLTLQHVYFKCTKNSPLRCSTKVPEQRTFHFSLGLCTQAFYMSISNSLEADNSIDICSLIYTRNVSYHHILIRQGYLTPLTWADISAQTFGQNRRLQVRDALYILFHFGSTLAFPQKDSLAAFKSDFILRIQRYQ